LDTLGREGFLKGIVITINSEISERILAQFKRKRSELG
jgi:hypothetical protein